MPKWPMMPLMSQVVSNTSPLTNLAVIGRLGLVRHQLSRVAVPEAVWWEMLALPHEAGRTALLAAHEGGWLTVEPVTATALATSLRLAGLDAGESEAIALAVETSASLLLIDEKKGRGAARRLGLPVTGHWESSPPLVVPEPFPRQGRRSSNCEPRQASLFLTKWRRTRCILPGRIEPMSVSR
jgi:predicted nucleic acid-binding protein